MIAYLLKFGLFCAFLLKYFGSKSHEKNYFWEIEGNPPSYLFGTMHVPYTLLLDAIPENTMHAFNNTQSLYLEIEINEENKSAMKSCQQLPNNQTVSDILPHDMYIRLLSAMEYIHAKFDEWLTISQKNQGWTADRIFKFYFDGWETRQPIWTWIDLGRITKTIIRSIEYPDLDTYLEDLGRRYGKFVGGIETVNDRCALFSNIKESYVIHLLDRSLGLIENKMLDDEDDYIQQYRDGTLLGSLFIPRNGISLKSPRIKRSGGSNSIKTGPIYDYMMAMEVNHYLDQEINIKRNLVMSRRIMDLIKSDTNTSFFFAFGAGHFIGDNSVVDMLQQKGVNITRVPRDRVIPQSKAQEFFRYSLPPR